MSFRTSADPVRTEVPQKDTISILIIVFNQTGTAGPPGEDLVKSSSLFV